MTDRTVHIDLELALHDEEVTGRAWSDGRPSREFTGWLGLIAVLDELAEPPTAAPAGDPPGGQAA